MQTANERTPGGWRTDAAVCALLAAVATVAFADLLGGARGLYLRDVARFFYPTKLMFRDVVSRGEFPLWNRFISCGQPFAANPQNQVFYPFTWLTLLPDFHVAFHLEIVLHLFIALAGMYALLRSLDTGRASAAVGALSFGLGGLCASLMNLLPILFAAAWLPLVCLFTRRFIIRRSPLDFACASAGLAMQLLIAEPYTVIQTALAVGVYAIARGWRAEKRWRSVIANLGATAAVGTSALLIAAVQILPALALVRRSARSHPLPFALASAWSMPWVKPLELLFPNLLGHVSLQGKFAYWGGSLYPSMGSPYLFSLYSGTLIAIAAIAGFVVRRPGVRLTAAIVAIAGIAAAGSHTPLMRALYDAGILSALRYPEKFALVAVFALIVFGAKTLDAIASGDERTRRIAQWLAAAIAVTALAIALLTFTNRFPLAMGGIWKKGGPMPPPLVAAARADWFFAALRCAAAAALFAAIASRRRAALIAAVVFTIADVTPVAEQLNPRMPRSFFEPSPLLATLPAERREFRLFHLADWMSRPDAAAYFRPQDLAQRDAFERAGDTYWLLRNGAFPALPATAGVETAIDRDYDRTQLLPTLAFNEAAWSVARSGRPDWYLPFARMSNACYVARYRDFHSESARVHGVLSRGFPVELVPLPREPRYGVAEHLVTIATPGEFAGDIARGSYPPRTAFIEHPSFEGAPATVRRVVENSNGATIDVDASGTTFVTMSVTRDRNWHVAIDGRPSPVIAANVAFQGVIVPRGTHRITMRYTEPLIAFGGFVSLAAVVANALLAARALRTRRHAAPLDAALSADAVR